MKVDRKGQIVIHVGVKPAHPAIRAPRPLEQPSGMPEISRFYGIVIGMFYNEYGSPHFHAAYGEHGMSVDVQSGVVRGSFPPRAVALVLGWAELHQSELLRNWKLAREGKPLDPIPPLE